MSAPDSNVDLSFSIESIVSKILWNLAFSGNLVEFVNDFSLKLICSIENLLTRLPLFKQSFLTAQCIFHTELSKVLRLIVSEI